MRDFAELYEALDASTRTSEKVRALGAYFRRAEPGDAAWAVFFLTGRRVRRAVAAKSLRAWAAELAGVPEWLFRECYDAVGDAAETIALLLPETEARAGEPPEPADGRSLREWVEDVLLPMRGADDAERRRTMRAAWGAMTAAERFVWNKLITGGFRVGVSRQLVVRALAELRGAPTEVVTRRLMGEWPPSAEFFERLTAPETSETADGAGRPDLDASRPYPFFLAHALENAPEELGEPAEWAIEWKWDGVRGQLLRRRGETHLWTRGEELVTEAFPELAAMAERLPDGVALDGEILPWRDGAPLPFSSLQRRLNRKTAGHRLLREIPVIFMAYDLLEDRGADIRALPCAERRARLEALAAGIDAPRLRVSPRVPAGDWAEAAAARNRAREEGAEGLMLKRLDSPYRVGRTRGDWWKWKVDPLAVDAVLVAARRGSGKRASLYTDYTFALRGAGGELVPFAQAYSGLDDREIRDVDRFVRGHMREAFGPVRTVEPALVFELGFEDVRPSARHKSGLAVRFPRILRRRPDKTPDEADTLETLRALAERNAPRPRVEARTRAESPPPRPRQATLFDPDDDRDGSTH